MTPKAWKRLFFRAILWGGILLGTLSVALLGVATWDLYHKEEDARMAHQDAAEDLSNLTAREKTLSSELYKLDTSQGVEEEIRQKYPLAKPGEEVIVLTAAKASTTTSSGSSSLWDEIVAWFSW
jgi:hypothetical protein